MVQRQLLEKRFGVQDVRRKRMLDVLQGEQDLRDSVQPHWLLPGLHPFRVG